jgi:integrase/recombinase XerD
MALTYTSIARKAFVREKVDVKLVAAIEQKALKQNEQYGCAPLTGRQAMQRDWSEGSSLYARGGGRKYLNHAERARVLAEMAKLPRSQALFALTLAWTGARVSEVLALTGSSFQIIRTSSRKIESGIVAIVTLKRRSHHVREVPIPPELTAALDEHFRLSAGQRDEHQRDRRLWPWHRVTAWRVIKRVMRRSAIDGRHACPRGLRHAFGVGSLQASVPLNLAQRWLGHARISTTAIYAAASGPEEVAFARRFWSADKAISPVTLSGDSSLERRLVTNLS